MAGRGYTFTASVEKDEDGRWNAWLNEIPLVHHFWRYTRGSYA